MEPNTSSQPEPIHTESQATRETHSPAPQSILTPIAILLAGILVAGAVLYNGAHAPAPTAAAPAPTTKPADITKVDIVGEPFIGQANAPVVIAYWSDYQCPFCQRHEQQVLSQIVANYVNTGKAKIVFKDYAFLGADSQTIGKYASAVWETAPDKFYAWHKAMFDNQGQENSGWATKEKLHALTAAVLGETTTKQVENLVATKGTQYQAEMDADRTEGSNLGVSGTPGTIIGKALIPGAYPYETFKTEIEKVLSGK